MMEPLATKSKNGVKERKKTGEKSLGKDLRRNWGLSVLVVGFNGASQVVLGKKKGGRTSGRGRGPGRQQEEKRGTVLKNDKKIPGAVWGEGKTGPKRVINGDRKGERGLEQEEVSILKYTGKKGEGKTNSSNTCEATLGGEVPGLVGKTKASSELRKGKKTALTTRGILGEHRGLSG